MLKISNFCCLENAENSQLKVKRMNRVAGEYSQKFMLTLEKFQRILENIMKLDEIFEKIF